MKQAQFWVLAAALLGAAGTTAGAAGRTADEQERLERQLAYAQQLYEDYEGELSDLGRHIAANYLAALEAMAAGDDVRLVETAIALDDFVRQEKSEFAAANVRTSRGTLRDVFHSEEGDTLCSTAAVRICASPDLDTDAVVATMGNELMPRIRWDVQIATHLLERLSKERRLDQVRAFCELAIASTEGKTQNAYRFALVEWLQRADIDAFYVAMKKEIDSTPQDDVSGDQRQLEIHSRYPFALWDEAAELARKHLKEHATPDAIYGYLGAVEKSKDIVPDRVRAFYQFVEDHLDEFHLKPEEAAAVRKRVEGMKRSLPAKPVMASV